MDQAKFSRRGLLVAGAAAAAMPGAAIGASAQEMPAKRPFIFCLNTATIMGQKLPLAKQIEVAGKAGYNAIEPWVSHISDHVKQGGKLSDLRKQVTDAGMTVEDAIGFAQWIVDDDARRAKGLEEAKRDMDLVAQIGGKRIAAPASGGTNQPIELKVIAERYRALAKVGQEAGIVPLIEVWGFSKNLTTLSDATCVALLSEAQQAAVLPDIFHLYKGGSGIEGLRVLSRPACPVLHMNDYPAQPDREHARDENRLYPGDGIAPLKQALKDLASAGNGAVLSLELFNREYWKLDALECARRGLEKMKAVAAGAMG